MKILKKDKSQIVFGIIGGKGQMGKLFSKILKKQGFKVLISDISTKLGNEDLVKKSDIIIVSVPIFETKKVIKKIVPITRKNQILMDLTSLKSFPIKEMLKSKAEVIGIHPMFGPGVENIRNQTIIICPARTKHESFIKKIFKDEGAKIHTTDPDHHDKMMSIVQVLMHFHTIVFGNTLKDLKVDLKDIKKYMSPIYRLEFDVLSRIFTQQPELYGAILMLNPYTKKITDALLKNSQNLRRKVLSENLKEFTEDFLSTEKFLGEFAKDAVKESDQIINYMKKL